MSILNQSRGVIDNYLSYKKDLGSISILAGDLFFNKNSIRVVHKKPKSLHVIGLTKDGDLPFLRKVYEAIEGVTRNS